MVSLTELSPGQANYGLAIRANVRALWAGVTDIDQFVDGMFSSIRRGLNRAWREGAKQCGIKPDELTPEELAAIVQVITNELLFVLSFADAIEAGSKANGGKLRPLLGRVELWESRYLDVTNRAILMACADKKIEWVMNPLKDNCTSCKSLNGKVKRGSTWERLGIRPQDPPNDKLKCKGHRCGCRGVPTDKPISRGPLPKLP